MGKARATPWLPLTAGCLILSLAGNAAQWLAARQSANPAHAGSQTAAAGTSDASRPTGSRPSGEAGIAPKRADRKDREHSGRQTDRARIEQLARKDPQAALALVQSDFEGQERFDLIALAIGVWAETSPEQAAAWLGQHPLHLRDESIGEALIESWAQHNPAGASRWVDSLADSSLRSSLSELLAGEWAELNGKDATLWAASAWPSGDAGAALHIALEKWVAADQDAVRRYLDGLQEPELLIEANRVYANLVAPKDPAAAWRLLDGINNPGARMMTAVAIVETLADEAPAATAGRVMREGDAATRVEMTRALVSKWIHSDLAAAGNWLEALASGPQQDAGLAAASEQLSSADPETALDWALRISNPEERMEAVRSAFAHFAEADPDAARSWAGRNDLPAEIRDLAGPPEMRIAPAPPIGHEAAQ